MGIKGSQITGGNSNYGRVSSDFYPTPPEVTEALLTFLKLPKDTFIWEPACGKGHMVNVFADHGFNTIGTDIQSGHDFLLSDLPNDHVDWIITNPPFSQAEQFIKHAAELGKPFAFLLKSQFWHARRRAPLFREYPPRFILALTWRPDFMFGTRGSGSPLMDVIWCVCGMETKE